MRGVIILSLAAILVSGFIVAGCDEEPSPAQPKVNRDDSDADMFGIISRKKRGHEASVIASIRTLSSVQEQYRSRFQTYGSLANLSASSYIDSVLGSGNKSGYNFTITASVDIVGNLG